MKAQFTRQQMEDNLVATERHLQDVFLAIGKTDYNGWTETVDLMVRKPFASRLISSKIIAKLNPGLLLPFCHGQLH
jgi:hypothetical protein